MCNRLYYALKAYHDEVKKFKNYTDEFFLFEPDYGVTPVSHCQAQRRKHNISTETNIFEIRLHDFRHSCVSLLMNNNVPIPEVSRYMGHASITETLNTYSHMFKNDFMNISDSINNLNKK